VLWVTSVVRMRFMDASEVQVFIAAHWMAIFFSQQQAAVNVAIAVAIFVANLADTLPTAAFLATSLKSVSHLLFPASHMAPRRAQLLAVRTTACDWLPPRPLALHC
jgi:hypothetical protein